MIMFGISRNAVTIESIFGELHEPVSERSPISMVVLPDDLAGSKFTHLIFGSCPNNTTVSLQVENPHSDPEALAQSMTSVDANLL